MHWVAPSQKKLLSAKQVSLDPLFCSDTPVFGVEAKCFVLLARFRWHREEICDGTHLILGWFSFSWKDRQIARDCLLIANCGFLSRLSVTPLVGALWCEEVSRATSRPWTPVARQQRREWRYLQPSHVWIPVALCHCLLPSVFSHPECFGPVLVKFPFPFFFF